MFASIGTDVAECITGMHIVVSVTTMGQGKGVPFPMPLFTIMSWSLYIRLINNNPVSNN